MKQGHQLKSKDWSYRKFGKREKFDSYLRVGKWNVYTMEVNKTVKQYWVSTDFVYSYNKERIITIPV